MADTQIDIPKGALTLTGYAPTVYGWFFSSFVPLLGSGDEDVDPGATEIKFQEGYSQRIGRGVLGPDRSWSLTFREAPADIDTIHNWLKARNGAEAFDWVPPWQSETLRVVCKRWSRRRGATLDDLICVFEMVFDQ